MATWCVLSRQRYSQPYLLDSDLQDCLILRYSLPKLLLSFMQTQSDYNLCKPKWQDLLLRVSFCWTSDKTPPVYLNHSVPLIICIKQTCWCQSWSSQHTAARRVWTSWTWRSCRHHWNNRCKQVRHRHQRPCLKDNCRAWLLWLATDEPVSQSWC